VNIDTSMTKLKKAGFVFALASLVRLLLNVSYLSQFGGHTTPVTETYFYYGVARGTMGLSHYDITFWLLRLLGTMVKGETLLYAVFGCGLLISSCTAVILYLGSIRILGENGAFVASLLYTFSMQPLTMGTLLFTHDLVQIPLFILLLYAGLRVGDKKILWAVLLIPLFLVALQVNPLIVLAVEVLFLYYAYIGFQRVWGEKVFPAMSYGLAIVFLILILLNLLGLSERITIFAIDFISWISPYSKEGLLSTLRIGSPDFVPTNVYLLWQRYNALFFLLPFGMLSFFKKKNAFMISLLFVSLSSSLLFDRATRIVDLAFALTAAEALVSWSEEWKKNISYVVVAVFAFALVAVTTGYFTVLVFLPFLVILLWSYILKKNFHSRTTIIVALFITYGVFILAFPSHPPQVSEAEYEAYRFVGTKEGKLILTAWDNGFAALAVSEKLPLCSPQNLDNTYQTILMKTNEEEALALVRDKDVDFIVVTSARFSVDKGRVVAWRFFTDYAPGRLSEKELRQTLLFRMLYEEGSLSGFTKIFEKRDESTGTIVKVFIPIVRFK
jgi:hypothetical protein